MVRILGSPYVTILTSPYQTVKRLTEGDDKTPAWVLVASASLVSGILTWLVWTAKAYIPGELIDMGVLSLGYTMAAWAVVAPLLSIPVWLLMAALYGWVGARLRGQGSRTDIRRAVAWSAVGNALPGLLVMVLPAVFPSTMSGTETSASFYVLTLLQTAALAWGVAITVGALAAAHRFSLWKGAALFIAVPVILVVGGALAALGFQTLLWLFSK